MVEESQQRKRKSEANLYVVPFGRYNLNETMPLSMMKRLDDEVPPVFMMLDTYDKGMFTILDYARYIQISIESKSTATQFIIVRFLRLRQIAHQHKFECYCYFSKGTMSLTVSLPYRA